MKKILLIPILLLSTLICTAQGSNGLVGHWDFNGNANDKSGHNLNGVVAGAQLAAGYNNLPNTAYRFSGIDPVTSIYHNILIPYDTLLNVKKYSICAMVRIDSLIDLYCQTGTIFWRGSQGNASYYALYYNDNAYDNSCSINSPSKINFLGDVGNAAYQLPHSIRGYTNYSITSKWYCLTNTFDGDTMKLYVDGVLYNKFAFTNNAPAGTTPIRIGASYGYAPQPSLGSYLPYPMFGTIDDIKFYNRELSISEAGLYCDSVKLKIGDPPVDTTDTTTYIHNIVPVDPVIIPNPARQYIDILLPHTSAKGSIQLLNSVGQVVAQQTISGEKTRFDLNAYTPGVYLLKIQYGSQMMFKKFLKE